MKSNNKTFLNRIVMKSIKIDFTYNFLLEIGIKLNTEYNSLISNIKY